MDTGARTGARATDHVHVQTHVRTHAHTCGHTQTQTRTHIHTRAHTWWQQGNASSPRARTRARPCPHAHAHAHGGDRSTHPRLCQQGRLVPGGSEREAGLEEVGGGGWRWRGGWEGGRGREDEEENSGVGARDRLVGRLDVRFFFEDRALFSLSLRPPPAMVLLLLSLGFFPCTSAHASFASFFVPAAVAWARVREGRGRPGEGSRQTSLVRRAGAPCGGWRAGARRGVAPAPPPAAQKLREMHTPVPATRARQRRVCHGHPPTHPPYSSMRRGGGGERSTMPRPPRPTPRRKREALTFVADHGATPPRAACGACGRSAAG